MYWVDVTLDLTASGGIGAQLNTYFSKGNCDRSEPGGTISSVPSIGGQPVFGGFGQCFSSADPSDVTEYLVDFVPGLVGSGYDLKSWSVQICPGCGGNVLGDF
jgi:hypothetical protein